MPNTFADDEIGEAGLKRIPTDRYSGQPFRYRVVVEDPIVYSVGEDQKDDQALVDWTFGKQPGDFITDKKE